MIKTVPRTYKGSKLICGSIRGWHRPANEDCPHNIDIERDCNCKRSLNRKPFRVIRVNDPTVPRQHKSRMVINVHPNGLIELREHGRRKSYSTTAGEIYHDLIWKDARRAAFAKKQARRKKGGTR